MVRIKRGAALMTGDNRTNEPTEAQWIPVPGYEDLYEVSDQGQVRSFATGENLTQTKSKYWRVWLNSGAGRGKGANVHTLVLNAFDGERERGQVARHLDDNKDDNRIVNLAWGSVADNNRDTVRNGNHNEANKTHCPKGHAYEGNNLVLDTKGHRRCRECDVIRQRERRARAALMAAADAAPQAEGDDFPTPGNHDMDLRVALGKAREHFTVIAGSGEIKVWEDTGEKHGIDYQAKVWAKRGERICFEALAALGGESRGK